MADIELNAGAGRRLLGKTGHRERRNREYRAREAAIVDSFVISRQEIPRHHTPLISRDRRQHRTARSRTIARGVYVRVRDALQELVHRDPTPTRIHAHGGQIQCIEWRYAARRVYRHLTRHRQSSRAVYSDSARRALHAFNAAAQVHLDSDIPGVLQQRRDQFRVELF